MLARADQWLIERVFEPVAHFTERSFGLSGFTLARFFMILLPVADATVFWQLGGGKHLFDLLLSLLIVFLRAAHIAHTESVTGANVEKHISFMVWARLLYIVLMAWSGVIALLSGQAKHLLWLIGGLGFLAHLYFAACDKPPPAEETAWGWRERQA